VHAVVALHIDLRAGQACGDHGVNVVCSHGEFLFFEEHQLSKAGLQFRTRRVSFLRLVACWFAGFLSKTDI
jgi:hypothetical protein